MTPASILSQAPPCSSAERLRLDVLEGLAKPNKELPCKYFYDETGSWLFEQITQVDEYYVTRAELSIMETHARDIAAALGPRCLLIEPGAGSAKKTRLLLARLLDPAGYVPIDIASEHLSGMVREMAGSFPGLEIRPVFADFLEEFHIPVCRNIPARKAAYFPGSTVGNFKPDTAVEFLKRLASMCGERGAVVIGVDLKKDVRILERAYNDVQGLTARFNLNLLARLNRELEADFQLSRFAHHAFYNPQQGRIEMHLVSLAAQQVHIDGNEIGFAAGETIHTENCYKYTPEEFCALATRAGLRVGQVWTDEQGLFSVQYLRV